MPELDIEARIRLSERMRVLQQLGSGTSYSWGDLLEIYKRLIQRKKPLNGMIELGVWRGGTLWLFAEFVKPDTPLIAIDRPDSVEQHDGRNLKALNRIIQRLIDDGHDVHFLHERGDDVYDDIERLLPRRKVDLLHLDGDHTYEGAKIDFERYTPFVRRGGIVLMHDVDHVDGLSYEESVARYWDELSLQRDATMLLNGFECRGTGWLSWRE